MQLTFVMFLHEASSREASKITVYVRLNELYLLLVTRLAHTTDLEQLEGLLQRHVYCVPHHVCCKSQCLFDSCARGPTHDKGGREKFKAK